MGWCYRPRIWRVLQEDEPKLEESDQGGYLVLQLLEHISQADLCHLASFLQKLQISGVHLAWYLGCYGFVHT